MIVTSNKRPSFDAIGGICIAGDAPAVARAIRDNRLKMKQLLAELDMLLLPVDPAAVANVNTPAEWAEFEAKLLT